MADNIGDLRILISVTDKASATFTKINANMNILRKGFYSIDDVMKQTSSSSEAYIKKLKKLEEGQDKIEFSLRRMLKGMTNIRWAMVNIALVTMTVVSAYRLLIKPSLELDVAMANVQKTTNFTRDEINGLRNSFINLSTYLPISAKELAEIARVAGQLGLGKDGSQAIQDFTTVVAMMTVATEMSAEEATNNLGKLTAAFNQPTAAALEFGNVINRLSNETAANATEISSAMLRNAAVAQTLGIKYDFVAATMATLISNGIGAERAGTTMSTAMVKLAQNLDKIGKSMGRTDLAEAFGSDPQQALIDVLNYMDGLGSNTDRVTWAIDNFGLVGSRSMLTLSSSTGELVDNLAKVKDEIAVGMSLINETMVGATTTMGQFKIIVNDVNSGLLKQQGFWWDISQGIRMTQETSLSFWETMGVGMATILATPIAGLALEKHFRNEELLEKIDHTRNELFTLTEKAGMTGEQMGIMWDEVNKWQEVSPLAFLDAMRLKINALNIEIEKNSQLSNEQGETFGEAVDIMAGYEGILDDAKFSVSQLSIEIDKQSEVVNNLKKQVNDAETAIRNLSKQRFTGETGILGLLDKLDIYIKKQKLADLGIADSQAFLQQQLTDSALGFDNLIEKITKTNDLADDGKDAYKAWRESIETAIESEVKAGEGLGADVSSRVKIWQTALLGISTGEKDKEESPEEKYLNKLQLAYDVYYGGMHNDVKQFMMEEEDKSNSMMNNSTEVISAIQLQQTALNNLNKELKDEQTELDNLMGKKEDFETFINDLVLLIRDEAVKSLQELKQELIDLQNLVNQEKTPVLPETTENISVSPEKTFADTYKESADIARESGRFSDIQPAKKQNLWDKVVGFGKDVLSGAGSFLKTGTFYGDNERMRPAADGGIFNSPTRAMIGEAGPEAVIPLNRGGSMGGHTFNINVSGGGPNVAEEIARVIKRELRTY